MEMKEKLDRKLTHREVLTRPGGFNGGEFTYIESWKAVEIANDIFNFNGWSCSIVDITPDFIEETPNGKHRCGITAVVKVTLRDGSFHMDVGFGCSENPRKGAAIENAKKEAVSDARKRALRLFGNHLGNCLYDKTHLKKITADKKQEENRLKKESGQPMQNQVPVQPNNNSFQQNNQIQPNVYQQNQPQSQNQFQQQQSQQNNPYQQNQPPQNNTYQPNQMKNQPNQMPISNNTVPPRTVGRAPVPPQGTQPCSNITMPSQVTQNSDSTLLYTTQNLSLIHI
eukprot:TRINITY_DN4815_c0_g1_i1.p1 TRINITY_DN4815_c0_g1~~TRINITY_DN4815_c0_g1_i1.p1  ORF type:complete len:321 (+),score=87.11 TRINITY_DN4815_c0_g1_i1:116-964(+)